LDRKRSLACFFFFPTGAMMENSSFHSGVLLLGFSPLRVPSFT
jgi:hypothetical protein